MGNLDHAVGFLENVHASMLHMGRLADVQSIRHGLPPESTDMRADCGLSPQDELLQTFSQALMALYMKPPRRTAIAESGAKGEVEVLPASAPADPADALQPMLMASSSSSAAAARVSGGGGNGGAAAAARPSYAGLDRGRPEEAAPPPPVVKAIVHGKWSEEEIALYNEGIRLFTEKKPSRIAALIGSRTGEQVRERIKHYKKRAGSGEVSGGGGAGAPAAAPPPPPPQEAEAPEPPGEGGV
jgi:hypothetical protein